MPSSAGSDWGARRGVPEREGVADPARWDGLDFRLGTNLVVDLSGGRTRRGRGGVS